MRSEFLAEHGSGVGALHRPGQHPGEHLAVDAGFGDVLAIVFGLTIVEGAIGGWNHHILASVIEIALLATIVHLA